MRFKPRKLGYGSEYHVRSIGQQVEKMREIFPELSGNPSITNLPPGAEGWFVVPDWKCLGQDYREAVIVFLKKIEEKTQFKIQNWGGAWETLVQTEKKEEFFKKLPLYGGFYLVPAQFGASRQGVSAEDVCASVDSNEVPLGLFEVLAMFWTHPERISLPDGRDSLDIICPGDIHKGNRVPLLEWDSEEGIWNVAVSHCNVSNDGEFGSPTAFR